MTVRPPFDPQEFARQSELATARPPAELADGDPAVMTEVSEELASVQADSVPDLAVAREDLEWFGLPDAIRDMLRHANGAARLDQICARVALPLDEGIAIVEQLVHEGIVVCR